MPRRGSRGTTRTYWLFVLPFSHMPILISETKGQRAAVVPRTSTGNHVGFEATDTRERSEHDPKSCVRVELHSKNKFGHWQSRSLKAA